jgi:hypothetical protein
MSLTSYRAAPPRDPKERHNAGRNPQRKKGFPERISKTHDFDGARMFQPSLAPVLNLFLFDELKLAFQKREIADVGRHIKRHQC